MRLHSYSNGTGGLRETWPFFCVSIMFTKQAIIALRCGSLNKASNKEKSILPVLHNFHCACFLYFEKLLLEDPSKHHAMHLDVVRKSSESNPASFLSSYYTPETVPKTVVKASVAKAPEAKAKSAPAPVEDDAPVDFDNLEDVETKEKKKTAESSDNEAGASTSIFSSILGGKESKFRVGNS